ncbi:diacylglycerol kinase [Tsuneonella deserti]|uniref:Diacylglycerol kinase n=1 Tax=Tsuneonella deserti TaxID=2035528 RepID=A0ABQ1SDC1_9SPHN|nr:diacylglycerol kinase family protein [Tsuneonella deserti]GGE04615.1 diacylglycerol kinase [Tsuneonella deserti]
MSPATPQYSTLPRVGVIFNPRSHRNRQLCDEAAALPGVSVASPEKRGELAAVLAGFAEEGVECIAISGGDGTVRDVLTAGMRVFGDRWPLLAVIPAGKTNALSHDLGAPKHWTIQEAVAAVRDGKRVVRRPMIVRDVEGGGELAGFVLGAGLFTVAVNAGQDAHRLGAFDGVAVVATALWGIAQGLFGSDHNHWRRGAPMRIRVGQEGRELPRSARGDPRRRGMLLAATLERFAFGINPYGRLTGLKLAVMDHPRRRLMAMIPAVAWGWESEWLEKAGLHRCSTDRILLDLGDRFILDGEAFPAGSYELTEGPRLSFVVP